MKNTKKAFTLVELIVVITILAILGTIAFLSIQGYSADARDGKRTEDLNTLRTQMVLQTTNGVGLLSLVSSGATESLASPSIAGTGTVATDYRAGTPNFTALDMKNESFQDPQDIDYRVGVTTKKKGRFEVAAKLENGSGEDSSLVIGDYVQRDTTAYAVSTGSTTNVVSLDDSADISRFYVGDTVGEGTNTGVITDISSDGLNITLDFDVDLSTTTLALNGIEEIGLINGVDTTGADAATGVTNGSTTVLPY